MNVIMHIPHSSTVIPEKFKKDFIVSPEKVQDEINKMTDWHVDKIVHFCNGTKIEFPISRLVCDVERFTNDDEEIMSEKGMGVCYTKDHNGEVFKNVSEESKKQIIEEYYLPHHKKLENQVSKDLKNDKYALIVDCHSFSSTPYQCDIDQTPNRPDICIGIDPYHTPEELVKFTYEFFSFFKDYEVEINTPFSGTMVPLKYYHKNPNVHSIMIEVNRSIFHGTEDWRCKSNEITSIFYRYIKKLSSCRDAQYEKINLYDWEFYRVIHEEKNNTIDKFDSVSYKKDMEDGKKHFRFSYKYNETSTIIVSCYYYLGTDYIYYEGEKILISEIAKKQLIDEYIAQKTKMAEMLQTGILFCSLPDRDCYYRKDDSKYYYAEIKKEYHYFETHKVSESVFEKGNWHDLYYKTEFAKNQLTYKTYTSFAQDYPEYLDKIGKFNELRARLLLTALQNKDEVLISGIMYMNNFETEEDIRILRKNEPDEPYFWKKYDLYDESMITIKSMRFFVPRFIHQTRHYEIKVVIEEKHYTAILEQNRKENILYIQTSYKNKIPIMVSQSFIDKLREQH